MVSVALRASRTALLSCLLYWQASCLAQAQPAWVDPPNNLTIAETEPVASPESAQWADQ
jgi:hypothetical protein